MHFSASGVFNFAQDDIFKKSIKASFKITKLTTSGEPSSKTSLHLYDHLLKPIVLYGSEIWGALKTNSAAGKRNSCFIFEEIYKNNIADKSQIKYLKYILGLNKHTSNLAILSETGRFPMYFSTILSVVKYLHCLETTSNTLLKETYSLSKEVHNRGIQTWYSSAIYILKLLNVNITSCRNLSENQLVCMIKKYLMKGFKSFWYKEMEKKGADGKLDAYFSIKKDFKAESYLSLEQFHVRNAICKLRLSAHNHLIETGRYAKPRSIP